MAEPIVEFPNRLNVKAAEQDTVRGDSLIEYPAKKGPWAVNPKLAHHGAGKVMAIAWIDNGNKIRSGIIAS